MTNIEEITRALIKKKVQSMVAQGRIKELSDDAGVPEEWISLWIKRPSDTYCERDERMLAKLAAWIQEKEND